MKKIKKISLITIMFLFVACIIICAVHFLNKTGTPPINTPTISTPIQNTPKISPASSEIPTTTIEPTNPPTDAPTQAPTEAPTTEPTADPCLIEHNFSDWIVSKKATCDSVGTQIRQCSVCEKTETKTIPQLEHKYTITKSLIATIDKRSETTYKCEHCGKTYTTYGEVLRPEIGKGYTCGDSLIGHGLEHSWDEEYMEKVLTEIKTYPKDSKYYLYGPEIYGGDVSIPQRAIDEYMYVELAYDCIWDFCTRYDYVRFGIKYNMEIYDDVQEAFLIARQIVLNLGITKDTPQRDAIAKINDFICEQKAYNYSYSRDTSLSASISREVGVCFNYACEFQLLCLSAGIECYVYSAIDMNHAWNQIVFPDGSKYWVDVCWNDARVYNNDGVIVEATKENGIAENTIRRLRNKYLLITTDELLKDHKL